MVQPIGGVVALDRDAILEVQDITIEPVEVPEWGGVVYVKALTGNERDAIESSVVAIDGKGQRVLRLDNLRAKTLARAICDPQGKRLFSDADIPALTKKSAAAMQRLFNVAQRLSGMTEEDVASLAAGLKNDQSDGSTSG